MNTQCKTWELKRKLCTTNTWENPKLKENKCQSSCHLRQHMCGIRRKGKTDGRRHGQEEGDDLWCLRVQRLHDRYSPDAGTAGHESDGNKNQPLGQRQHGQVHLESEWEIVRNWLCVTDVTISSSSSSNVWSKKFGTDFASIVFHKDWSDADSFLSLLRVISYDHTWKISWRHIEWFGQKIKNIMQCQSRNLAVP